MSLNYYYDKVRDSNKLLNDNGAPNVQFTLVIHMTMIIDVGDWTEKNMEEVCWRVLMYESIFGAFRYSSKGPNAPAPFTCTELMRYMGLRCNVITLTRAKWMKRVHQRLMDEHKPDVDVKVRDAMHQLAREQAAEALREAHREGGEK